MAFSKDKDHDGEKQPLINGSALEKGKDGNAAGPKPLNFLHTAASFGLSSTAAIIIYYAFCSSTMLIINKVAVFYIPAPSFLMTCQMAISAFVAQAGHWGGLWETDALEWNKITKFLLVVLGFLGCIFSNMKVLQNSNVETFITFRSSTPLILSFCDYLFLGRALPNARSWGCLLLLLAGAVGYVMTDTAFQVDAYVWLACWYAFFVFDCVYVKHTCDNVRMTNWGRVLYTNLLTIPFLLPMTLGLGETTKLSNVAWDATALIPLGLSCAIGVGMSHASYLLREACTATLFTIVGIICKIITVIINYMIWDKHASPVGISFLMICVLAGTFYQQAPKRTT